MGAPPPRLIIKTAGQGGNSSNGRISNSSDLEQLELSAHVGQLYLLICGQRYGLIQKFKLSGPLASFSFSF